MWIQAGEPVRLVAQVGKLHHHVSSQLLLQRKIVLVNIRRTQVRLHEVHAAAAERDEPGVGKIKVGGWRFGWKRIDGAGCPVGVRQSRRGAAAAPRREDVGKAEETAPAR